MGHSSWLFSSPGPQSAPQLPLPRGRVLPERLHSPRIIAWISQSTGKTKDYGIYAVKSTAKQWDSKKSTEINKEVFLIEQIAGDTLYQAKLFTVLSYIFLSFLSFFSLLPFFFSIEEFFRLVFFILIRFLGKLLSCGVRNFQDRRNKWKKWK